MSTDSRNPSDLPPIDLDDEATVLRPAVGDDEPVRPRPAAGAGIFSNNAAPVRSSLPTEEEGDALLDMLLADPVAPAPATPPPRPPVPKAPPTGAAWSDGGEDESVDEPTRMLSALALDEQERIVLDLDGRPVEGSGEEDEPATLLVDPENAIATLEALNVDRATPVPTGEEPDDDMASAMDPEDAALDAVTRVATDAEQAAALADIAGEPPTAEAHPPEEVLQSMRPVPLPSRAPPASDFVDEQDAASHLLRTQQRDAWVERAEWLLVEARAMSDKARRARTLLQVSELYAMAGEDATAKSVAEEARELVPTMALAHQQVRAMWSREGDFRAMLETLDMEAKSVPIPALRNHVCFLGAELSRLRLGDADGAYKRVELSARALASDPRAHVQRFTEALAEPDPDAGTPAAHTKVHVPEAPPLAPIASAFAQVAAHRRSGAATRSSASKHEAKTTYETFLRARAALAADDLAGALGHLDKLGASDALAGGVGWLATTLASSRKETRKDAATHLRAVAGGSHGDIARRNAAALALATGDAAATTWALSDAGGGAFSAADRLVLAALSGPSDAGASEIAPWISPVLADSELAPIAAATHAALGSPDEPGRVTESIGEGRGKASAALGRALSAAMSHDGALKNHGLADKLGAYADATGSDGVARTLAIEVDADAGFGGRVARAISEWHQDDGPPQRDRALGAAVLAELAGEPDRAVLDLDRAREADGAHEGAVRARAMYSEADDFSRILAAHAETTEASHAPLLLIEAVARLQASGADDAEIDRLLRKAISLDPKLPIPLFLAERIARGQGDREGIAEHIRTHREASDDPMEQALDLVREAILLGPTDPAGAAGLLDQALQVRPKDIGLREMYERLAPEPPSDRAAWRLARAAETKGAETARLALEAAMDLERGRDLEQAATASRAALVSSGDDKPFGDELLAAIIAHRAALAGHGAGDLVDALLPQARASQDAIERLEIYERLAELDERGRGDAASGLLWRKTILEETPSHLPTLRRVASDLIAAGRHDELEPVAIETARALSGAESVAHAMLSARLRLAAGTWESTREPVDLAYKYEPRGVWVLRQMAAHARAKGEHALAIEADQQLIERTDRPAEAATISMRAAESASAAGDLEAARRLLTAAVEMMPEHLSAHLALAQAAETAGDLAAAAGALETAASASVTPEEKSRNLYRAAVLWQDKANDAARARAALEAVAELDPAYEDVFQRLQNIYIAEGARSELAALLEARLSRVTDPTERVELEVLRGRALADVGDAAAAKLALAAALDANPDHGEALSAFADVCAAEEDWAGAEDAWIRLARLASDAPQQIAIYNKLGDLYDDRLPNPERAELSYNEILKRDPANEGAREKLVALYKRTGDTAKALEQQTVLINNAEAPEDKCKRTTELALIYEVMGDAKKAEATLLGARKTYPKDDVALVALASFYQRTNQAQAAQTLLDRAVTDARRALGAGRFEPYLFSTLATVSEIRSKLDAARAAKMAVAALDGEPAMLEAAGPSAGDPELDEQLAPEVMTPAFRDLLQRSAAVLDTAVPFDLTSIRAAPIPPQQEEIADEVRGIGAVYGLPDVRVLVSSALGAVCVPASSHPPTVVLGQALVASPRAEVRTFLVHRALKVVQVNASAFSRTAPIDLWPLLAAFLRAYSPSFSPQGVDAGKLNDFYGRITRAMAGKPEPHLATLAADVIGSIGNRASTLATAVNGWGNRVGFLALGDANAALTAIAWAGGNMNAPPVAGKDRLTWIGRNAEARELMVFAVSDAFAAARTKLGVGD